ncbi:natriuretic peptide A-like [Limanda limanda]|uniref:natriuretic peptide A-like n=1 Tax=Limanda limanda TaxID=27771 RepID=UPI0029C8A7A8|nr:natriuretic peptide A-like [Limanda limanda]
MQKKTNPSVSVYCFSLLLWIHFVGAKSVFDLQILKPILQEKLNTAPYYYSEEMEAVSTDGNKSEIIGSAPEKHPPEYSEPDKQSILARLLKDLMRTSKRSSSRYKKGGLRSCFGVRLERIGSFSGLGC